MRIIRYCLVIVLSAGATVKSISRETEHGVTLYEVETSMNGLSRDRLTDQSGVVVEVEEQVALAAAPLPVQQSSKKRTVTVDSNGQVVAPK